MPDFAAMAFEQAGRLEVAESIVAEREATMGRAIDPSYRSWLVYSLSSHTTDDLLDLQGASTSELAPPAGLGDSSADLVYTPVPPCRLFDTRSATAGILVGGTQRNFFVAGSTGFTAQGGNSTGCGIPFGPATSVIINFAAVTPTGAGNLRAWAVANPQPAAPLAAVMNYSTTLAALANGVAVPICDLAATSCASDLRLQADVSSVHIVGDVVGYFRKVDITMRSAQLAFTSLVSGDNYVFETTNFVPSSNQTCVVTCDLALFGGAEATSGFGQVRTARRTMPSTDANDGAWNNYAYGYGASFGTGSKSQTWTVTGGTAYRFGCYNSASGSFVGDSAYNSLTYVCR